MLSARDLGTILSKWASHLSHDKCFVYTAWDAKLALKIKQEIKEINRQDYETRRDKLDGKTRAIPADRTN
jgi:hypothetical protein